MADDILENRSPFEQQLILKLTGTAPPATGEQRARAVNLAGMVPVIDLFRAFAEQNPEVISRPATRYTSNETGQQNLLGGLLAKPGNIVQRYQPQPDPLDTDADLFWTTANPEGIMAVAFGKSGASTPTEQINRFADLWPKIGEAPESVVKRFDMLAGLYAAEARAAASGVDPLTVQQVEKILNGPEGDRFVQDLIQSLGMAPGGRYDPAIKAAAQKGQAMPAQPAGAPKGPSQPRFDPRKGLIRGTP